MSATRYCKCHFSNGESEHWGLLDRKSFAQKGAKAHFTPDTPLVPKHLQLSLHFDWEEERVWGSTTYDLCVKGADVRDVVLDAVDLEISEARIGNDPVEFENTGENVRLFAKKPFKPGSTVKVNLLHSVTRPVAGIYFTKPDSEYPDRFQTVWTQGQDEDSRYYFPCFDKPNFKQTTEVILHLPPKLFGLSNGRLLREKHTDTESLYHYKLEIPYSTYLLSIVAGDFEGHTSHSKGVDIKWYVQRGRMNEGHNAFKDTGKILSFFSGYTGYPYPYEHYTQIAVPEFVFGGMENFTVTTQTDLTLHDDRAALDIDSNGLVAHEAAHMWFGDVVTAKNWSHAWLHESFATYFDALYTRESKGEEEFRYQCLEDAETYFSEEAQYRRPIVTHIYKEPIDLFDAHLYPGGAVRLHHLKSIVGEEVFRKALAIFLKRHEYGLVETVDFFRCLEEVTAQNHDEWLDQWIYRGGYPRLELSYSWEPADSMAVVTVKQTQTADKKDDELLFKLPLDLAFYFSRGEERFPVTLESREQKFCFRLKSRPLYFRLDPDYVCPAKKVKLDVSRSLLHEQLKRDKDPIGRIEAAAALAQKPSMQDVKILGERLRKESFWGVGGRIARALGKIGGDAARDALIKGLAHKHPKVRFAAARALGNFLHDDKAAKALIKTAAGDDSYRVEAAALESLGRVRAEDAREILEDSLDRPSHNDMAQSAIYNALAQLEEEASWEVLLRGADYGAARNSRGAAMRALARLARRYEHKKSEAIEQFTRFARETRGTPAAVFRGKLGAIQAMKQLDDLAAVSALRHLAENDPDGRIKRRAEETVAALHESAKKPKEMKAFRSELDDVAQENKSLRDRLDLMEKKQEERAKKKKRK